MGKSLSDTVVTTRTETHANVLNICSHESTRTVYSPAVNQNGFPHSLDEGLTRDTLEFLVHRIATQHFVFCSPYRADPNTSTSNVTIENTLFYDNSFKNQSDTTAFTQSVASIRLSARSEHSMTRLLRLRERALSAYLEITTEAGNGA